MSVEHDRRGRTTSAGAWPVVAVVGRPNVGKSTLVNRIIGRREAVVQDVPGVTRDRVSYDALWNGRQFVVVDTGGWASDATGMAAQIAEQAEIAIDTADAVVFVVDATVGVVDEDEAVVRVLRRSQKPVVLAANKVDDQRTEAEAAAMWNLGLGEPYAVSALHGRGSGDLLDAILEVLPTAPTGDRRRGRRAAPGRHRRQAERRQVESAEHAGRSAAGGGRQRRRHHRRPGRRAGGGQRHRLPLHRHRRDPAAGEGGVRSRVLRQPANPRRDRAGRGVRGGDRRQRAGDRAGPADPHLGGGGRPGAGDRVQQVGPDRRRAAPLPDPGDRARSRAVRLGVAGQHLRPDRPARRPAAAGDRGGARQLGEARSPPAGSTRSWAGSWPRTRTRSAVASSRGSCSAPRRMPVRRPSCCSPRARSRPATSGSSSGGCGRSSTSPERRCTFRCGLGRSAASRVAV